MSRNLDPAPSDDPRELGRVCPACKGRGFLILALGPDGESAQIRVCGLCEGTGEITRAHTIRLWRELEAER